MKKLFSIFLISAFFLSADAYAQLRGDVSKPVDYQGTVINAKTPPIQSKLNSFFSKIRMSHSYSMNFSSFGGSFQNVNAYTNTMYMQLTDRLDARVDVSLFHSPFSGLNSAGMGFNQPQIRLSNAELNYRLGENSFIQLRYSQIPAGYGLGFSPYGYGYNRLNRFNHWGY